MPFLFFNKLNFNVVPIDIKWNDVPMTMRGYEKRDDLKDAGNDQPDIYYTSFNSEFQKYFPMYGTKSRNEGDSNKLTITKPFLAFMIRDPSWASVDVSNWRKIATNQYLSTSTDLDMYEKHFDVGTHYLDNSAAYYLFREGNNV